MIERDKIDTPNTHIYDRSLSVLGADTQENTWVKLVLCGSNCAYMTRSGILDKLIP